MPSGGHFIQKGWTAPRGAHQNFDRSGWSGVRPGDTVGYNVQGAVETGFTVVILHDSGQSCSIRKGRREFKINCEWLKVERAVDAD